MPPPLPGDLHFGIKPRSLVLPQARHRSSPRCDGCLPSARDASPSRRTPFSLPPCNCCSVDAQLIPASPATGWLQARGGTGPADTSISTCSHTTAARGTCSCYFCRNSTNTLLHAGWDANPNSLDILQSIDCRLKLCTTSSCVYTLSFSIASRRESDGQHHYRQPETGPCSAECSLPVLRANTSLSPPCGRYLAIRW